METTTSRRAFIGAASMASAIGLTSQDVLLANASPSNPALASPRLLRAIALHDRAARECGRFDEEVELPARARCASALKTALEEATPDVPHETVTTTYVSILGNTVRLSTDKVGADVISRRLANDPTWADIGDEDFRQAHRELLAATERREKLLERQMDEHSAIKARVRSEHRIQAIADRAEALANRQDALWDAAISFPSRSVADMATKLAFVDRTSSRHMADYILDALGADARRLAGEGR